MIEQRIEVLGIREYNSIGYKNQKMDFETIIPSMADNGKFDEALELYLSQGSYSFGYFLRLITRGLRSKAK